MVLAARPSSWKLAGQRIMHAWLVARVSAVPDHSSRGTRLWGVAVSFIGRIWLLIVLQHSTTLPVRITIRIRRIRSRFRNETSRRRFVSPSQSRCYYYYRYYLSRRLASEGIVTLGVTLSRFLCVCRFSLGGEGNALYLVLCSYYYYDNFWVNMFTEYVHCSGEFPTR